MFLHFILRTRLTFRQILDKVVNLFEISERSAYYNFKGFCRNLHDKTDFVSFLRFPNEYWGTQQQWREKHTKELVPIGNLKIAILSYLRRNSDLNYKDIADYFQFCF